MDLRWGILAGYGPLFWDGLLGTIELTVVAIGAGLVLGVLFGLISSSRDAPRPKSALLAAGGAVARSVTLAYVADDYTWVAVVTSGTEVREVDHGTMKILPRYDVDTALDPRAPRLHPEHGSNVLFERRGSQGDVDGAEHSYSAAARKAKDPAPALLALGRLYFCNGRLDQAMQALESAAAAKQAPGFMTGRRKQKGRHSRDGQKRQKGKGSLLHRHCPAAPQKDAGSRMRRLSPSSSPRHRPTCAWCWIVSGK